MLERDGTEVDRGSLKPSTHPAGTDEPPAESFSEFTLVYVSCLLGSPRPQGGQTISEFPDFVPARRIKIMAVLTQGGKDRALRTESVTPAK